MENLSNLMEQMKNLQEQLEKVNNLNTNTIKKRQEGSFEMLKNGKARLQFMLEGKRYSENVEVENEEDAKKKLILFVNDIKNNRISNSNLLYSQYMQYWFDNYVKKECSQTVIRSYKNYINKKILPNLGNYKLKKINSSILRNFFNELKNSYTEYKPPRENKPISKETYRKVYNIIHSSLKYAFELDLITVNSCDRVPLSTLKLDKLPSEIEKLKNKHLQKERAFDITTYKKVLELLDNKNAITFDKERVKKVVIETALKTGFSLEELAGLQWDRDYNKKNSTLTINIVKVYIRNKGWIEKEPKANSRKRCLKIPSDLNKILKLMRKAYPKNTYIFSEIINFNSFTSWFEKWEKKNNITPVLTTHELRHTHATIMLKESKDLKAVSKRLGHSNTSITINTYVESLSKDDENLVNILEKI